MEYTRNECVKDESLRIRAVYLLISGSAGNWCPRHCYGTLIRDS